MLARTLQKLHIAYEEGKKYMIDHGDEEKEEESGGGEGLSQEGVKAKGVEVNGSR